MKVLLTGAGGFIGRHVLDALVQAGIETVAVGRTNGAKERQADFVAADLLAVSDFRPLISDIRPSHLVHLAWYAEHGKYWSSPLNLRWSEATVRLVESFCAMGGEQVVTAGTCAEYDWSHGYCREETTPVAPATLYGAAKDATGRLVAAICRQHQVPSAWGRIFLPYGPGDGPQRLIPSLTAVFRGERPPFSIGADAFRDFVHVCDVASAFVTLLKTNADGVYNISSGAPVQVRTIVQDLARLCGGDAQAVLDLATNRPGDPALLVGENLKLKALGWQPTMCLSQGLQEAIARNIHEHA